MVTPFGIAVAVLGVVGTTGLIWVLWPTLRSRAAPGVDDPDVDEAPADDALARLLLLADLVGLDDDGLEPWTLRAPLVPEKRVQGPFRPSDAALAVLDGDRAFVMPLTLLEQAEPTAEPPHVIRGRALGRAFHAIRLESGVYLDLIAAAKLLPLFGAELAAETTKTEIRCYPSLQELMDQHETVIMLASWLLEEWQQRVVPEGDGARSFDWTLEGQPLHVEAWMPSVREGVELGEPLFAARVQLGEHRESSLLSQEAIEGLQGEWASPSWHWSRDDLLEVAGIGHRLGEEGVDLFPLVRDAFQDRQIPDAEDDQDRLVVAAVLNWAGVVVRRSGRPQRALGYFDAGLSVCGDGHDDNRADLHYNRGYSRLHAACSYLDHTEHAGLQRFGFDDDVPAEVLEAALRDFTLSSGLNPNDPDAWSQIALIHQLRGNRAQASEAWLQAATRARDEAVRQALLANAEAMADNVE